MQAKVNVKNIEQEMNIKSLEETKREQKKKWTN